MAINNKQIINLFSVELFSQRDNSLGFACDSSTDSVNLRTGVYNIQNYMVVTERRKQMSRPLRPYPPSLKLSGRNFFGKLFWSFKKSPFSWWTFFAASLRGGGELELNTCMLATAPISFDNRYQEEIPFGVMESANWTKKIDWNA